MRYKIAALICIAIPALLQLVPYGRNHSNPPVQAQPKWDSPTTKEMFARACADCHSNQTRWPWYTIVAPISWLVQYDVDEGRRELNVSMWGVQRKNEGHESVKEVEKGSMPPWSYTITHREAALSPAQMAQFLAGLRATFGEGKTAGEKSGSDWNEDPGHQGKDDH